MGEDSGMGPRPVWVRSQLLPNHCPLGHLIRQKFRSLDVSSLWGYQRLYLLRVALYPSPKTCCSPNHWDL